MKISEKQIEAILALPNDKKFKHFIKTIVAWEQVWGLYEGGWALAATSDNQPVFPLWPAKEYASLCACKEWSGYEPKFISLNEFTEELLPQLRKDGVLPGVFYTPNGQGVTPPIDELLKAIEAELERY